MDKKMTAFEELTDLVWKLQERITRLENKNIGSVGSIYSGSNTQTEVIPAKYMRITPNLVELQAMYDSEKTQWESDFIQSILDFSGQTVTEKQYDVLQTLANKRSFDKDLVTQRKIDRQVIDNVFSKL